MIYNKEDFSREQIIRMAVANYIRHKKGTFEDGINLIKEEGIIYFLEYKFSWYRSIEGSDFWEEVYDEVKEEME